MMGERKSLHLDSDLTDRLNDMVANGDAPNFSEAVRIATRAGLEELGYRNGGKRDTTLRAIVRRAADASAWASIFLAAFAYFGPLEIRLLLIPMLAIPLSLYTADRVLSRLEPRVSRGISGLLSRGETT